MSRVQHCDQPPQSAFCPPLDLRRRTLQASIAAQPQPCRRIPSSHPHLPSLPAAHVPPPSCECSPAPSEPQQGPLKRSLPDWTYSHGMHAPSQVHVCTCHALSRAQQDMLLPGWCAIPVITACALPPFYGVHWCRMPIMFANICRCGCPQPQTHASTKSAQAQPSGPQLVMCISAQMSH